MLDESEFLSEYGVRALSRVHRDQPYTFPLNGHSMTVCYQSGESHSGAFGGNSNWRGPIWFPVNYLLIESLEKFHHYYGDEFQVECPTGSGQFMSIGQVAAELSRRLSCIFLRGTDGQRPVSAAPAGTETRRYDALRSDPNFRDCILFHEYFDGDTGRGVGASHQCGWTGLVAKLLATRAEGPGQVAFMGDAQSRRQPARQRASRKRAATVPVGGGQ